MTERGFRFLDVDENHLELWLKQGRVQLVVIDSRPELEAGELRRFAAVLFAEYVGRDLADRLAAARCQLADARDAAGDPRAALDGALRAIDELTAAMTVPASAQLIAPEPEPPAEPVDALPPPGVPQAAPEAAGIPLTLPLRSCRPYPSLKPPSTPARKAGPRGPGRPPGGNRAGERRAPGWH